MSDERNDIPFDNTKVTFDNTPNNIETSDELNADPLYYRQMGTAYSTGKKVKKALIGVGIAVTATGGIMLSVNLINNSFLIEPTVENINVASTKPNEISFSFKISKNEQKLTVIFTLSNFKNENVFTYRAVENRDYESVVSNLNSNTAYNYKIQFTNNVDLLKEVSSGIVTTLA